MRESSILYALLRRLMKPGIQVFYRRIQIVGQSNFPKKGAVLICGNHVNAFMDPVALQLHSNRPLYSLARGDAFQKPWAKKMLTKLHILPIYRKSEGVENLSKNEASFSASAELLQNQQALIIYPEAICVQERRIRKLKKGAARILFEAAAKNEFKSSILALPVGMNYTKPYKFRSDLLIIIGEPLKAESYASKYKANPQKAMLQFTNDLELELQKNTIHLQNPVYDQLIELLFDLYLPVIIARQKDTDQLTSFQNQQQIVGILNQLSFVPETSIQDNGLNQQIKELEEQLLNFSNTYPGLNPVQLNLSFFNRAISLFTLIVGYPIFIPGLILHGIPFWFGNWASNRLAKNREFKASLMMSIAWISWMLLFLLETICILFLPISTTQKVEVFTILILLGFFTLYFHDFLTINKAIIQLTFKREGKVSAVKKAQEKWKSLKELCEKIFPL